MKSSSISYFHVNFPFIVFIKGYRVVTLFKQVIYSIKITRKINVKITRLVLHVAFDSSFFLFQAIYFKICIFAIINDCIVALQG